MWLPLHGLVEVKTGKQQHRPWTIQLLSPVVMVLTPLERLEAAAEMYLQPPRHSRVVPVATKNQVAVW